MQVSVENTANLERRMTVSPARRAPRRRHRQPPARDRPYRQHQGLPPRQGADQGHRAALRRAGAQRGLRRTDPRDLRRGRAPGEPAARPATRDIKAEPTGAGGEIRYTATFEVVPDFGEIDVDQAQGRRVTRPTSSDADIDAHDRDPAPAAPQLEAGRARRRRPVTWCRVETCAADRRRAPAGRRHRDGRHRDRFERHVPRARGRSWSACPPATKRQVEVDFPADWRVAAAGRQAGQGHLKVVAGLRAGDARGRRGLRQELRRQEWQGRAVPQGSPHQPRARAQGHADEPPARAKWPRSWSPPTPTSNCRRAWSRTRPATWPSGRRTGPPAGPDRGRRVAHERFLDRRPASACRRPAGRRDRPPERPALDPSRVNETMHLIASTYEEPKQVIELYRNDPNLMRGLQNRVMEEQVIDWIAERADAHRAGALSFADVMRPVA